MTIANDHPGVSTRTSRPAPCCAAAARLLVPAGHSCGDARNRSAPPGPPYARHHRRTVRRARENIFAPRNNRRQTVCPPYAARYSRTPSPHPLRTDRGQGVPETVTVTCGCSPPSLSLHPASGRSTPAKLSITPQNLTANAFTVVRPAPQCRYSRRSDTPHGSHRPSYRSRSPAHCSSESPVLAGDQVDRRHCCTAS